MRSEKTIDLGGGCCSEETGRSTSRSAFVQVVGLLNTYRFVAFSNPLENVTRRYLPLTVIHQLIIKFKCRNYVVFVINVKWFTQCAQTGADSAPCFGFPRFGFGFQAASPLPLSPLVATAGLAASLSSHPLL